MLEKRATMLGEFDAANLRDGARFPLQARRLSERRGRVACLFDEAKVFTFNCYTAPTYTTKCSALRSQRRRLVNEEFRYLKQNYSGKDNHVLFFFSLLPSLFHLKQSLQTAN